MPLASIHPLLDDDDELEPLPPLDADLGNDEPSGVGDEGDDLDPLGVGDDDSDASELVDDDALDPVDVGAAGDDEEGVDFDGDDDLEIDPGPPLAGSNEGEAPGVGDDDFGLGNGSDAPENDDGAEGPSDGGSTGLDHELPPLDADVPEPPASAPILDDIGEPIF